MLLSSDLDSVDLAILRTIANQPLVSTREIEAAVFLSRAQVLRRIRSLEDAGLVDIKDGGIGQPFRYRLSPAVTLEEIERFNQLRLTTNCDPVAREALSLLLQGLRKFDGLLQQISQQLNNNHLQTAQSIRKLTHG